MAVEHKGLPYTSELLALLGVSWACHRACAWAVALGPCAACLFGSLLAVPITAPATAGAHKRGSMMCC